MNHRRRLLLLALLPLGAALSAAGCAGTGGVVGTRLTVLGAASLGPALVELRRAYEAARPGTLLTISTDSSAALETQIEQGAPADVFLSADTANPQKLVDRGLASGPVVAIAANRLTVIVPTPNPGHVMRPADLGRPGLRVIAAGDSVPITRYAVQLVANLARLPGYPPDFAAAYAANVASREDNVAAVVSKVALGEGDAAIVYATDAMASQRVTQVDVPVDANVAARYGGVVVKASPNQAAAAAFLAWLTGPDGQAILGSFGFQPPAAAR